MQNSVKAFLRLHTLSVTWFSSSDTSSDTVYWTVCFTGMKQASELQYHLLSSNLTSYTTTQFKIQQHQTLLCQRSDCRQATSEQIVSPHKKVHCRKYKQFDSKTPQRLQTRTQSLEGRSPVTVTFPSCYFHTQTTQWQSQGWLALHRQTVLKLTPSKTPQSTGKVRKMDSDQLWLMCVCMWVFNRSCEVMHVREGLSPDTLNRSVFNLKH